MASRSRNAGETLAESPYVRFEAERRLGHESHEEFDRIAFAIHTLRLLRPNISVWVYPRARELSVSRDRHLPVLGERALVGIPVRASKQSIARALAELAGVEDVPFIVDLLVAAKFEPLC